MKIRYESGISKSTRDTYLCHTVVCNNTGQHQEYKDGRRHLDVMIILLAVLVTMTEIVM